MCHFVGSCLLERRLSNHSIWVHGVRGGMGFQGAKDEAKAVLGIFNDHRQQVLRKGNLDRSSRAAYRSESDGGGAAKGAREKRDIQVPTCMRQSATRLPGRLLLQAFKTKLAFVQAKCSQEGRAYEQHRGCQGGGRRCADQPRAARHGQNGECATLRRNSNAAAACS